MEDKVLREQFLQLINALRRKGGHWVYEFHQELNDIEKTLLPPTPTKPPLNQKEK